MIVLEVCMPARCWIAPEIPTARYSWGETVLPVCPTWKECGYQPASVTARDAPTAAPRASASFSTILKPSSDPVPRPPETTICASVRSGRSPFSATTRSTTVAALAASDAEKETASTAAAPADASGEIAFGRTAMIGVPALATECTVIAPPKFGCSATGAPSGPAVTLTASVSTPEPVLTASRPAISLPSVVPAISTAAGDTEATREASSSAAGATTYPAKSAESATYTFSAPGEPRRSRAFPLPPPVPRQPRKPVVRTRPGPHCGRGAEPACGGKQFQ